MASSGSIVTNQKEGRSITLSWTLKSQSVANNTSTIEWTLKGSGSSSGWVMAGGFKAVINGTTVYSSSSDTRIQLYNGTIIASGTLTISHNSDGTKSFGLSCQGGVYTYDVSVTASGTHTLNTIPRSSSVSAKNVNLGSATTITITRASSSFTHTLTYKFGNATGTIASKTTSTSLSWTPPLSLANQIPKSVSGLCTITCVTFSGSTKVGSKTCTLTLTVPASVKPTIASLTAVRFDGTVPSSWGIYVQSKSKAVLTINGATGSYGSSITAYSITGGGFSSTVSSFTTGLLMNSGTITFTAKVTDSRGRVSNAKTVSITVVPYSAPTFTSYLSQRSLSDGTLSDDGTYIRGLVSYIYSSCNSKNTVTCTTYFKHSTITSWSTSRNFTSGTPFVFGGGSISTESSYDVKYTITDAFTTVSIFDTVSTAAVLMDFKAGGKGIAVGKVSERDNTFELADDWKFRTHGKELIDLIYPVGSIYISVVSTNPSILFGGTWSQIKDLFLLACGSTYAAGRVGGEAYHKLAIEEMPKHAHDTPFFNNMKNNGEMKADYIGVFGKGMTASEALSQTGESTTMEMWWVNQTNYADGSEFSYLTSTKGGNGVHNNMPPYVAVYMWKRTA